MKPPKKLAKKATVNKSAFVRSLADSMSANDVVKAAAEKGIKLSDKFVHTIRYNAKKAAAKNASQGAASAPAASPIKRGPGRPRKATSSLSAGGASSALQSEIERIVEAKVTELLRMRFGMLFGQ